MANDAGKHKVVVQKWEESERGWGVRPDGYSMHLTDANRKAYIQAHWDSLPNEAPDEYSRPSGAPYDAVVGDEIFARIKTSENGVRFWSNEYPGAGGTDGWIKKKVEA